MAVTLYLRVLGNELKSYRARGWKYIRYLWPLKGQHLIRKTWKG